jgi:hypothetical protein
MSVGVNSFWVAKFHPLVHLPMFGQAANVDSKAATIRGTEILLLILAANVALLIIYRYQYKLVVRKRAST